MEELLKRLAGARADIAPHTFIDSNYTIKLLKHSFQQHYDEQLEKLISTLKHDIKTPTIANIHALEYILAPKHSNLNTNQKDLLELVLSSSKSQFNMINELIQTLNFRNQSIILEENTVDIVAMVKTQFNKTKTRLQNPEIILTSEYLDKTLTIQADQKRLQTALENIFSNIITQTNQLSKIKISVTEGKNGSIIIKLDQNYKQELPVSKTAEYGGIELNIENYKPIGSGLSLELAREIINAHNGQLRDIHVGKRRLTEIILPQKFLE